VNFTALVQGDSATLTPTCFSDPGEDGSVVRNFTVSGNQVTFFQNYAGLTLVSTFERQ
jgi:hypothetical protein